MNSNTTSGSIMITEEFEDIHLCEWFISAEEGKSILFKIQNQNLSNRFKKNYNSKF